MVPIEALLGYVLLLVGFVFFANGMTLLGKTGAKEVGVLNLGVGVLIAIAAWKLHTLGLTAATALVSVFALIYLIVYAVFVHGHDAKGLGVYCLFATVVFIWYGAHFQALGLAYFAYFCWGMGFAGASLLPCVLAGPGSWQANSLSVHNRVDSDPVDTGNASAYRKVESSRRSTRLRFDTAVLF